MPNVTVKYEKTCGGGNHIYFRVFLDGVFKKRVVYDTQEILNPPKVDWEDVLLRFMLEVCDAANATTLAQKRAAIEAKTWVI